MSSANDDSDAYALLGVASTASASEIKAAFRVRALDLHPDKNPSPHAAALFHAIKTASETLLDSTLRAALDVRLAAARVVAARAATMNADRARLRSELESREASASARAGAASAASARASDVERLRREGVDRARAMATAAAETASATAAAAAAAAVRGGDDVDALACAVRASWPLAYAAPWGDAGPPESHLREAFALCGRVAHVLARKRGSAVVVFAGAEGAEAARVAPPPGMFVRALGGGDGSNEVVGGGGGGGGGGGAHPVAQPTAARGLHEHEPLEEMERRVLARAREAAKRKR
jgi:DnaJ family protein C protein 17